MYEQPIELPFSENWTHEEGIITSRYAEEQHALTGIVGVVTCQPIEVQDFRKFNRSY